MQQSQRRTEALGPLKDRVARVAGTRLHDKLALQIAIACAMREPDELVDFLAPRHVVAARQAGHSILITPDGSRGPKYKMKSGVALIARKTQAPVYLLALNFSGAWRLNSWDRFYIPWPFSRVELSVQRVEASELTVFKSLQAATEALQTRMLTSNIDGELTDAPMYTGEKPTK